MFTVIATIHPGTGSEDISMPFMTDDLQGLKEKLGKENEIDGCGTYHWNLYYKGIPVEIFAIPTTIVSAQNGLNLIEDELGFKI